MVGGIDVKQSLPYGVHHGALQHQVAPVAVRNQHALVTIEPGMRAVAEVTFNLLVNAATGSTSPC